MNNNKGQTLYYFLIFTMILVVSWAMMLNIGKVIRDRMILQNEADNAVISIAAHKARTMNAIANLNYLEGVVLAFGTDPDLVQIPSFRSDLVASYISGDTANGVNVYRHNDVEKMKKIVDFLQDKQEWAMRSHAAYATKITGELAAKGYGAVFTPSPITAVTDIKNLEKYFGIKRNSKGIKYLYTINTGVHIGGYGLSVVYNPAISGAVPGLGRLIGIFSMSTRERLFGKKVYAAKDYSWYVEDEYNIYKQKIKIRLVKISQSSNPPLFSNLLHLSWMPAATAYSAAAIYNTKGTMFPKTENTNTGIPAILGEVYLALHEAMTAKFIGDLENLLRGSDEGAVSGAALVYIQGVTAVYTYNATDKDNPIDAYTEAKSGGWSYHLVPYYRSEE